jgi:hypothetical protein
MSLAQISEAYHGRGTLLSRVEGACLHSAAYIRIEAPETVNHANRLLWMAAVQADVTIEARKMLARVLENGDIQANTDGVADATIQYVVDVLVNEFATGA